MPTTGNNELRLARKPLTNSGTGKMCVLCTLSIYVVSVAHTKDIVH